LRSFQIKEKDNIMSELHVTSLEQIKSASQGELVELSPFPDGTQFVARLRKPNIMSLVRLGKIPNELLALLTEVNEKKSGASRTESPVEGFKQSMELQEVFCKACLVSPTWSDIEACGGFLTDTQIAEIALYAQGGIKALRSFREQSGNNQSQPNGESVQSAPESVDRA